MKVMHFFFSYYDMITDHWHSLPILRIARSTASFYRYLNRGAKRNEVKSRSYSDSINGSAENTGIEFSSVCRSPCWGLRDADKLRAQGWNEVINSWGHQCASKSRRMKCMLPMNDEQS